MKRIISNLRKTSVILFVSFFLSAVLLISVMTLAFQFYWTEMFHDWQKDRLRANSYLLIDDMRREQLTKGPLTEEESEWLFRRAALYNILLKYEDGEGLGEVWYDSLSSANPKGLSVQSTISYVYDGNVQGILTVAPILDSADPTIIRYKEKIDENSRWMYYLLIAVSFVLCWIVSRRATIPLHELKNSAAEISSGRRDLVIPVKGPEEIRQLALALNELTSDLKKQEVLRNNLTEDLMHELRTPLTSMLSQTEAIIDGVYEASQERLEEIYEELTRLTRLLNNLEKISEAEGASFNMIVRRYNMVQLVRRVYLANLPMAKGKSVKLIYEPVHVPCFAEVDLDKIVQVITNIVVNAIKYTQPYGQVTLGVGWTDTEEIIIYCRDTGVGISPDNLPYIFDRLYRADKSRSRVTGGIGLGLSIVKALVEVHNGRIEVSSELNVGSEFRVYLPNKYKRTS